MSKNLRFDSRWSSMHIPKTFGLWTTFGLEEASKCVYFFSFTGTDNRYSFRVEQPAAPPSQRSLQRRWIPSFFTPRIGELTVSV